MRGGSRDAVLDGLAMAEAYLRDDEEGLNAILRHCDPAEVARSLAIMLGGGLRGEVAAQAGRPKLEEDEATPDEVFAALARVRENLAAQYDRQSQAGD